MQLLLIPRLRTLFDELFDCLAEAVKRLFVILLDRVDDAVLDMVLQDHLAGVFDGGAYRSDLDEHLGTVTPILDHALDRLQMADRARQTIDDRLGLRMGVGVSMPVAVRVVMFMHMHFAIVAVGDHVPVFVHVRVYARIVRLIRHGIISLISLQFYLVSTGLSTPHGQ